MSDDAFLPEEQREVFYTHVIYHVDDNDVVAIGRWYKKKFRRRSMEVWRRGGTDVFLENWPDESHPTIIISVSFRHASTSTCTLQAAGCCVNEWLVVKRKRPRFKILPSASETRPKKCGPCWGRELNLTGSEFGNRGIRYVSIPVASWKANLFI